MEIDTAPRLAARITQSRVGSAPSLRRRVGAGNPSLTTMSAFRATLKRPRCAAMAFSADVATWTRIASARSRLPAVMLASSGDRGS